MKKNKHRGRAPYRFANNPEERRFALAWSKLNNPESGSQPLAWSYGDGLRPVEPSDEACMAAATVIQWLGSPVGQCFLRDLGYEKKAPKPEVKEPKTAKLFRLEVAVLRRLATRLESLSKEPA